MNVAPPPGVFTDDTADMTLSLIIAVSRRLAEGDLGHELRFEPSGLADDRRGWASSMVLF